MAIINSNIDHHILMDNGRGQSLSGGLTKVPFLRNFFGGGGGQNQIFFRKTEKNLEFKVRQKPEGRLF